MAAKSTEVGERRMSEQSQNDENEKKKKKKRTIIIIAIVVLLLIVIGILIYLLLRMKPEEDKRGSVRTIMSAEDASNASDDMREQVAKGMFECEMSMNWTFPDGSSPSEDAYVGNSTNNKYPIYFDVILDDTGETIYSSPVIPVGSNIASFPLDVALSAGTYKATVMYTLVEDVETQEEISQAGFVVTINVLN
jgi:predicted nucleic acid-binding Zn ribbon protein